MPSGSPPATSSVRSATSRSSATSVRATAVLLNTTALERGLGTGGSPSSSRRRTRSPAPSTTSPRCRATSSRRATRPSQTMVLGVDEQDSEHHAVLRRRGRPRRAAGRRRRPALGAAGGPGRPARRGAGAAGRLRHDRRRRAADRLLPHRGRAARGRLARGVRSRSARPSAATSRRSTSTPACWPRDHVVGADVVVVSQGPGNLGTGTRWGFSGTSAGEAVNAAGTLGGRPVCSLRDLGGRPARAAPRGLAPQPDGIRPGRARPRRRAGARCCRRALGAACSSRRGRWRRERRAARARRGGHRRPRRGAARRAGAAVDHGPRIRRRPRRIPRRGRRGAACRPDAARWSVDPSGPATRCAQRTSSRSTTKISVSPGLMAAPAPRSP